MLTQNENQGGDYSMYSTAYPSSVTGNQGYNSNYGEMIRNDDSKRFIGFLERTDGDATPALLSFLQAGDISSPGGNSTVSACIRASEHKTRARTPDTATQIISQHRLSDHSVVF